MTFRFDKESHRYFLDEKEIPGTTQILKTCGLIDDKWFNESARRRGELVHKCCHFLAEGDLDWKSVSPKIGGYVRAYERFLKEFNFTPKNCEEPRYHPTLKYGTTPDQFGLFPTGLLGVVELKTGSMQGWTALQTAFQAMALCPDKYLSIKRYGVELHEDGTYRAEEFTNLDDFNLVVALRTVYDWISQNPKGGLE